MISRRRIHHHGGYVRQTNSPMVAEAREKSSREQAPIENAVTWARACEKQNKIKKKSNKLADWLAAALGAAGRVTQPKLMYVALLSGVYDNSLWDHQNSLRLVMMQLK